MKQAMAKLKRRTSIKKMRYNDKDDKFSELNDLSSAVNQIL